MLFYSDGEYEQWKQDTANASSWTTKYYKGLGTSTKQEFQKYFANPKIVELKQVEVNALIANKWNGVAPTTVISSGSNNIILPLK